jgi:hypothetical protein
MKMYRELYKKELLEHREEYIALLIFTAVALAVIVFGNTAFFKTTFEQATVENLIVIVLWAIISGLFIATLAFFPMVLFHFSFRNESKNHTASQIFSLPIPRYMLMLIKTLSIMSVAFLLDILTTFVFNLFSIEQIVYHWGSPSFGDNHPSSSMNTPVIGLILIIHQFSLFAIFTTAAIVSHFVPRYRLIIGFPLALAFFTFYMQSGRTFGLLDDSGGLSPLYTAVFGMMVFLFALTLYHKFSEV